MSDQLYKKRQARGIKFHKRTMRNKNNVLIVCEDGKSSPKYFEDLIKHYNLKKIKVSGAECGSAPISVVEYAVDKYNKDKKKYRVGYDKVYCVIDRDTHDSYTEAHQKILGLQKRKSNKIPIEEILSVPCFEFWLLLHFKQTSKDFATNCNLSPCEQLIKDELSKKITGYNKGRKDIFSKTKEKIPDAINNAEAIEKDYKNNKAGSYTDIHKLIKSLISSR